MTIRLRLTNKTMYLLTIFKMPLLVATFNGLLQSPALAQAGSVPEGALARVQSTLRTDDACPARNVYLNKTCRIKVDKLYVPAEGKPGYEILPLWEENQTGTVTRVECLPHVGIRVYLKLEDGREGYLEINREADIPQVLEQTQPIAE